MLDAFGDGHWTLTIDADGQLVYPHYEEVGLALFCRYLDHVRAQAVFCLLLDMYSNRPVAEAVHDPAGALLHFKFLCDFHVRVETEVAHGEHDDGAREYRAYRDLMRKQGGSQFYVRQVAALRR